MMKSGLFRFPSLLLSALLQLSPLLRVASTEAAAVASPLVAVLRWFAGASAVAGSFHAVSAATGLTITGATTGTNGVLFSGARASISSGTYGAAQSYSASGLPAGLVISKQGVITGTPTKTGSFTAQISGWKSGTPGSGDHYTGSKLFTIVDPPAVKPVLTQSPQPLTVTEGNAASFTAAASGTPAPTFQWLFNNGAIPAAVGAQYQIAQTALTNAGSYAVIALNSAGAVTSAPVALTVIPAAKPPVITNQPASLTVKEGSNAVFSVAATGTAPLAYQWLFNTAALSAATNATLTLSNVSTNQAGSYQVRVSNALTNVLSNVATLTVTPRPVAGPFSLGGVGLGAGGFSLTFPVVADVAYVVEDRDTLDATNWITLTNIPPPSASGTLTISDPAASPARFYRVRTNP